MRLFAKLSLLIALVGMVCSVGGVFAVWIYFEKPAADASKEMSVYLGVFEYKPEEVLPDMDGDGESHFDLNDQILLNSKIGINMDTKKKTFLTALTTREYHMIFSWENVQGNNIAHIFHVDPRFNNLDFTLWYDTETGDIYSYTYRTADIEADDIVVDTSKISVYRTRFVENANGTSWSVAGSAPGYATVVYSPGYSSQLVIDPLSWKTWEG